MSAKLVAGFMLLFFLGTLLSSVMEGGGGFVATTLTADITAASGTLNVTSTEGFFRNDYVHIGNEKVMYTNTTAMSFTGCTRGYDGTTAAAHSRGDRVYSPDMTVLNSALGFNVATTGGSVGEIGVLTMFKNFFFITLPKLITWDYSWCKTGWTIYIRLIMAFVSVGFSIYMVYIGASAFGHILSGIFGRR
jgi:hypothetical protein